MNGGRKKWFVWGGAAVLVLLAANVLNGMFRAAGMHGHGPRGMEMHGRYMPHHGMQMAHHSGGVSLFWLVLFLILGVAILIFVVKKLRQKNDESAMQEFISTSMQSPNRSFTTRNADLLDQWEKNNKE